MMGSRISRSIILVSLLGLTSCTFQHRPKSLLTIKPVALDLPDESVGGPSMHTCFWDAMAAWDLSFVDRSDVSPEQEEYVQALQRLADGDSRGCLEVVQALYDGSPDMNMRRAARRVINQVHVNDANWSELIDPDPDEPDPGQNNREAFREAMRRFPPQECIFVRDSTEIRTRQLIDFPGIQILPVKVNGRDLWFILDTGASFTALSQDAARLCGITTMEMVKAHGETIHGTITAQIGSVAQFAIGGLTIQNHLVMVLPNDQMLTSRMRFDGIVGLSTIYCMDIEIDYTNSVATVRKPKPRDIEVRNLLPMKQHCAVRAQTSDHKSVLLTFDTGCSVSLLDQDSAVRLGLSPEGSYRLRTASFGKTKTRRYSIIPRASFVLGSFQLEWTNMGAGNLDMFPDELYASSGLFGCDIFEKGGRLRIDWLNRRVDFSLMTGNETE